MIKIELNLNEVAEKAIERLSSVIKIELNLNEVAEKAIERLSSVPSRIKIKDTRRWKRWWFDNQLPRAHVVAETIHRTLHPTVDAGSIGTLDQDSLRTGGGIFGTELGNQAESSIDGFYGSNAKWQRGIQEHHSEPSVIAKLAGHVIVLIDGSMGIPSNTVRWCWRIRDGYRWQDPIIIPTEDE